MRKLNISLTEKNDITEEDFNRLLKANLITTSISNSSSNDIKKANVIFYTPYGLGKRTINYIEIAKDLTKGLMNPLISSEVISHLNNRIQQEEQSSRIYLAMSMHLNNIGYTGASSLWLKYSKEELVHADWARNYLLSMGVTPKTPILAEPNQSFPNNLVDIINISYKHEIEITNQCKELAIKSLQSGDFLLHQLVLEYLKEQVEEHNKMQNWSDKIESFGTDKIALKLLDSEMGN